MSLNCVDWIEEYGVPSDTEGLGSWKCHGHDGGDNHYGETEHQAVSCRDPSCFFRECES